MFFPLNQTTVPNIFPAWVSPSSPDSVPKNPFCPAADWTNDTINPQPKFFFMELVLAFPSPPKKRSFLPDFYLLIKIQASQRAIPESMTVIKIVEIQSNSTKVQLSSVGFCKSFPSNCHHLPTSSQTLATAKLRPWWKLCCFVVALPWKHLQVPC